MAERRTNTSAAAPQQQYKISLKPRLRYLVCGNSRPNLPLPGSEALSWSLSPASAQRADRPRSSLLADISRFRFLFFARRASLKNALSLCGAVDARCDSSWRIQRGDITACGRRSGRGQRKSRRRAATTASMAGPGKAPAADPAARARLRRERSIQWCHSFGTRVLLRWTVAATAAATAPAAAAVGGEIVSSRFCIPRCVC